MSFRTKLNEDDRVVINMTDNSQFKNMFTATVTDLDTCKLIWVTTNEKRVADFVEYGKLLQLRYGTGIYDDLAFLIVDPTHNRGTAAWFMYRISSAWFTEQPRYDHVTDRLTGWDRVRIQVERENK